MPSNLPNTIQTLPIGHKARITAMLPGDEAYRHKLMNLGLIPGTELEIMRVAPLGDPIEVAVRGYRLVLRRAEAGIVAVELVS